MATSMSLSQLMQPVEQAQTSAQAMGERQTGQVMDMANAMQNLQQKQLQQQDMQERLQQMKWNSAKGMLNTYMNASPKVRKALKSQMGGRLKQMNADPGILDALDDQDTEMQLRTAMQAFGDDPNAAAQGMAALGNLSTFSEQLPNYADLAKQRVSLEQAKLLAQAREGTKVQVAEIGAESRQKAAETAGEYKTKAAEITAGPGSARQEALLQRESGRIHNDSRIKKFSDQIDMMDNIRGILSNPKGITNQEFNDAQIEVSNAIAGARGAALGKLERTEYDTLQQKIAKLAQSITGKPTDAVPPEILKRFQDLVNHTQGSFLTNRSNRAKALKRTSANPAVMQAQDEAIQSYLHDEGGVPAATQPQQRPMAPAAPSAAPAQAPGKAAAPTAAPKMDKATALKTLVSKTKDPARIKSVMQQAGHTVSDQEIQAAIGGQ